jgi:hypothetical protein
VTRVVINRYAWTEAQVTGFIDLTYRVAAHNRNRRDVCQRVDCVTDDLDVAYEYPVKKTKTDATNYGTCFYVIEERSATGKSTRYAVIHLMSGRGEGNALTTLTHEVAHALTQGSHGYTWRRMFALLLPLAWKTFDHPAGPASGEMWLNVRDMMFNAVERYAVRYAGGYVGSSYDAEYATRVDKIIAETDKHIAAAQRYFKIFGE